MWPFYQPLKPFKTTSCCPRPWRAINISAKEMQNILGDNILYSEAVFLARLETSWERARHKV
jgi:hypothetical protein